MNYYMITLTGQGDTYVKIVDQETWDWVTSKEDGKVNPLDSSWDDAMCPLSIRTKMWEEAKKDSLVYENIPDKPEDFPVHISIGSWDNDRAIMALAVIINGKEASFDGVLEAMRWCQKNNIMPLEEYKGYIY